MPDPVPGDTVLVDPRGARELRVIQTTWAGKITASPFRGGRHGAPETFQTHETLPVLGLERALPLVAALVLRRRAYGAMRCASKSGLAVASLLEARGPALAILRAHPGAAAEAARSTQQAAEAGHPLHVAALVGASEAVLRALARAEPGALTMAGFGGRLPLHCALLSKRPPAYAIRALCSEEPAPLMI